MKLNENKKFKKLENSIIHCQLENVIGGMYYMTDATTGSATDKSTCSSGKTDDSEADDHD